MLERWRAAGQIRTFAGSVEQALGDGAEEPTAAAYLAWMRSEADRGDSLGSPESIPGPSNQPRAAEVDRFKNYQTLTQLCKFADKLPKLK